MGNGTCLKEGAWQGQACYVIGGGPSLKSFDWGLLSSKKNLIAINMAFLKVPHAEVFFTEDERVITELIAAKPELHDAWKSFRGVKVYHCLESSLKEKVLAASPDVHVVERKRRDKFWAKSFIEGLSYSSNSAVGAINIATLMGADPIYLMGIDCRTDTPNPNYHDHYPQDWRMPRGQDAVYKSDFENWVKLHTQDRHMVSLINPEYPTALDCWPRLSLAAHFEIGVA